MCQKYTSQDYQDQGLMETEPVNKRQEQSVVAPISRTSINSNCSITARAID